MTLLLAQANLFQCRFHLFQLRVYPFALLVQAVFDSLLFGIKLSQLLRDFVVLCSQRIAVRFQNGLVGRLKMWEEVFLRRLAEVQICRIRAKRDSRVRCAEYLPLRER